jgi:hypothetical protein
MGIAIVDSDTRHRSLSLAARLSENPMDANIIRSSSSPMTIPLDFTENISHVEMLRFVNEIAAVIDYSRVSKRRKRRLRGKRRAEAKG